MTQMSPAKEDHSLLEVSAADTAWEAMVSWAPRITPESRPTTLRLLYIYLKVKELSIGLKTVFGYKSSQCVLR